MSPGEDGLIGIPFPEHSSELLSCLNAQRRAGLLCDLTLTSRGARYPTHRSVMAAVSLYFRKLFGAEEGEAADFGVGGGCSVCQLDCVAPDALDALLEFAYTATLTIRSSGMREVLKAAQLLGIQCVADACRDILGERDEEEERDHAEEAERVSRRKKDRRHVSKSGSPHPHSHPHSPSPSSPPLDYRQPLATTSSSPEYEEHSPAAGQNGDQQGGSRVTGATVNGGGMHWAPGETLSAPTPEDGLSEEEDRGEYRDGGSAVPPVPPERGGAAGGGRKRKSQTPQQCPVCQKIIHGAGKLPRHMRTHTGEKPFQCSACGVRFTRNDKLKIHMRKHTGERPYPCPDCPARFLHSYDLKNHRSLHSGARPFECPLCHKAFAREDHLQRHRKGHSCLELRTRRPRRGPGPGPGPGEGGGSGPHRVPPSLLDPLPLAHTSAFPHSPPQANSSGPPLLYPPDPDSVSIPYHALPLLAPHRLAYASHLWRGMGLPGGTAGETGGPPSPLGSPPTQARWEEAEDGEEEEEEEEEEE
ncbi:zinc finger and BTB domain-containing protein 7B [Megalops cyprinoides]|uniref:zinc finger and BTB domain-containing protein 7B n=1 Tax=Megalops cyprinoides TaxID=118141 RepID=UPI001863CC00|nr:zinc finger and BTB domain-containing protein 7B [Megalops cyprinoides]XP_036395266.1 zinc finger and BTB domain-containing protein 7B [Megalops cyprinoides]